MTNTFLCWIKNNENVQDDEKSEIGATFINIKNFVRLIYFMKYFMKYLNIEKIHEILHLYSGNSESCG